MKPPAKGQSALTRGIAYSHSAAVLAFLGILLSLCNVMLIRQNRNLRAEADYFRSLQHTPVGAKLPALLGKDCDGREMTVSYGASQPATLMFVFSPSCVHCRKSWSQWLQLAGETSRRVVFVNVGGSLSSEFIRRQGFGNALVVASIQPESILKYGFYETPLTLLVSPDGVSEKVWSGEVGPSRFREIEDALKRQSLSASIGKANRHD